MQGVSKEEATEEEGNSHESKKSKTAAQAYILFTGGIFEDKLRRILVWAIKMEERESRDHFYQRWVLKVESILSVAGRSIAGE